MSSEELSPPPPVPAPPLAIVAVDNNNELPHAPQSLPSVAIDVVVLQKIRIFLRAVGEAPAMTVAKFNIDGNKTIMDVSVFFCYFVTFLPSC